MKQLKLSPKCSHDKLIEYGFKKHGLNYKLSSPLYTYKDIPVISVTFLVSGLDHYIGYDIIDNNSDMLYSPYYDPEYAGNNKVLKTISKKMTKMINDMVDKNIIKGDK